MRLQLLAAAALLALPALGVAPVTAPARAQGLGVATHCVVFMSDGSRISVTYGTNNEACVNLGRRCAGSQPYNAITFYSSPVYSGAPYRICSLT